MSYTAQQLAAMPVRDGFRQRGEDMTRLETFTDAAFAFAVTLLVVGVDRVVEPACTRASRLTCP